VSLGERLRNVLCARMAGDDEPCSEPSPERIWAMLSYEDDAPSSSEQNRLVPDPAQGGTAAGLHESWVADDDMVRRLEPEEWILDAPGWCGLIADEEEAWRNRNLFASGS
jgi:hypothetical protein